MLLLTLKKARYGLDPDPEPDQEPDLILFLTRIRSRIRNKWFQIHNNAFYLQRSCPHWPCEDSAQGPVFRQRESEYQPETITKHVFTARTRTDSRKI
jgi:hypothetical protein